MLMLVLCSMLEQEPSRQTSQGTLTYRQAYLLSYYEHSVPLLYSIGADWQYFFSFSLSPNKPVATDNILLLLFFFCFFLTGRESDQHLDL